jgi:hypothetical protein
MLVRAGDGPDDLGGALAVAAFEGLEHIAQPRRLLDPQLLVQSRAAQVGRYQERRDIAGSEGAAEPEDDP